MVFIVNVIGMAHLRIHHVPMNTNLFVMTLELLLKGDSRLIGVRLLAEMRRAQSHIARML